jgi:cobalamin biosynthesis Mg chelatase CobN
MRLGTSAKSSADLQAVSREKTVEAARQTPGWIGLIVGMLVILIALGLGWKKLTGWI